MNQVSKKGSAEVATDKAFEGLPTGLENVTTKDLLIPRITILQALSPQVTPNKPEYIKDAKVGEFCDVGLGKVFKELVLVPVVYKKEYLEWAPRSSGKGLVAIHSSEEILKQTTRDDKNRAMLPNGNYIQETAQFYCINLSNNNQYSFFPLASTGLKHARKWLTLINAEKLSSGAPAPIFYRAWNVTAMPQSNNEGSWFAPKFEASQNIMELFPDGSLLKAAKEFHEQAKAGLVRGDLAQSDDDDSSGDEKSKPM